MYGPNTIRIPVERIHVCTDGCKFEQTLTEFKGNPFADFIKNNPDTKITVDYTGIDPSDIPNCEIDMDCNIYHKLVETDNPNYCHETGKCNLNGTLENEWVKIPKYLEDRTKHAVVDMDEIVICDDKISIEVYRLLKNKVSRSFKAPNAEGFTRRNLIDYTCDIYQRMYNNNKPGWRTIPSIDIESIRYDPDTKIVHPFIGS